MIRAKESHRLTSKQMSSLKQLIQCSKGLRKTGGFKNSLSSVNSVRKAKININLLSFAWYSHPQLPLYLVMAACVSSVARTQTKSVEHVGFNFIVLWNTRGLIGNLINSLAQDIKVYRRRKNLNLFTCFLRGITHKYTIGIRYMGHMNLCQMLRHHRCRSISKWLQL